MFKDVGKNNRKKKPFFQGFLAASSTKYTQQRSARNQKPFLRNQFNYQQRWQPQSSSSITTNNRNGECFLLKSKKRDGNFFSKTLKCFSNSTERSRACSSINITAIFGKGDTKSTTIRRLKHMRSLEKLTSDLEILEIIEGYKIPLIESSSQRGFPSSTYDQKGRRV